MLRALLTAAALLALAAPSANAAILQVDTGADVAVATPADCTDGDIATACSIRDALAAAGATAEDDRVLVPAGDYVLNGTSLQVTGPGNVTLVGEGPRPRRSTGTTPPPSSTSSSARRSRPSRSATARPRCRAAGSSLTTARSPSATA
jgi:hypothetical protein